MVPLCTGVVNSKNMSNSGRKSPAKGNPVLNPLEVSCSKRYVRTLYVLPKSQKYAQGIVHDGSARVHTAVLDTGFRHSMVGMEG